MKINVIEKSKVVAKEIVFSESQLILIRLATKDAKKMIEGSTDYHMEVATIICDLCDKVFGKSAPIFSPEGNMLIAFFAEEIGFGVRAVKNWVKVKSIVIDRAKPDKISGASYQQLYDIEREVSFKKRPLQKAIDEILNASSGSKSRMLAYRYARELLSATRKCYELNSFNSELRNQIFYHIKEVKLILERK